MEMDNAALMQVINTQNMLLQSMQGTQKIQSAQPDAEKMAMASALSQAQEQARRPMPAMSPYNGYAMYEPLMAAQTPVYSSGKKEKVQGSGFISQTVNNYLDYDPSRNSKESTSDMFAEQTKSIQDKVLGGGSALAQGAAFAGSFFVPGLLPSLAVGAAGGAVVGGTVGAITDGAETASKLEEILRTKGIKAFNAFESTTEFGGAGMHMKDRQEMAKHIRHLAPEKLLEDQEMQQILGGALDNKLLKSATDMESFKKKFDNIVDQVKQITLTMNQSIEEATAFMGEMERRGIGTKDMSSLSAKTKVVASLWGTDPSKAAQQLLGTTDAITQGTSLDATNVMGSVAYSATLGTMLEERYKKDDDKEMYHYLKNNGGADQVAMNTVKKINAYVGSEDGNKQLIGIFGSAFEKKGEKVEFNTEKFKELASGVANGSLTYDELKSQADRAMKNFSKEDKAKIMSGAGEMFSAKATGSDMYQFIDSTAELLMKTGNIEDKSVAIKQLGGGILAGNNAEAEHLANAVQMNRNGDIANLLNAKSIREEMDAYAQSNTTGIWKSMKYWAKRNIGSHFGDAGQFVGDKIADFSTDFQKWQTGIGDRSIIGGEILDKFGEEDLKSTEKVDAINAVLNKNVKGLRGKKDMDITDAEDAYKMEKGIITLDAFKEDKRTRISKESFSNIIDSVDDNTITGSTLRKLQDQISSGKVEGIDKQRAEYATKKANGEYDGVWGTIKQGYDRASIAFTPETPIWGTGKDLEKGKVDISGNLNDTIDALKESGKQLEKKGKDLNSELKKVFSKEDLGVSEKDYTKLESLIKSGDVDKVKELTSSSKAAALAEKYKGFAGDKSEQEKAMKAAKDMGRQSEGYARLADGMKDFVGITGVFDDDKLNSMFSGYEAYGDSFKEQLEKGKISVADIKDQSDVMLKKGKEIFENMSPEQLRKVAESLQSKTNGQIKIESLVGDNGAIDSQKVFNAMANDVIRAGHADKTDEIVNGKEGKGDGKKVKDAAKDHEKALDTFVSTMTKEAKKLNDAANSIKNGSYTTKTTYSG